MLKTILVFLLLFGSFYGQAQTVPSSCKAPGNIVALYEEDASRLALRKIFRQHLTYKDSVKIPETHVDTVLHALLAVYNSNLPARDTVIDLLDIHTFRQPTLNSIVISASAGLSWMQQLQAGNMNTGDALVDKLIADYGLTFDRTFTIFDPIVVLKSGGNYNITALSNIFQAMPGVQYAHPNGYAGDGSEIQDSIHANYVELTYSYGWGDCPSGCINRRFWKFKVYFDCSVEYAGSYGDPLHYLGIKETAPSQTFTLYPNPFKDEITVEGFKQPFHYQISNITGQELVKGRAEDKRISGLEKLRAGLYFLHMQAGNQTKTLRIYRQ